MSSCLPTFTFSFCLYCEGDLRNKKEFGWAVAPYGCVWSRAESPGSMRAPCATPSMSHSINVTFPADTEGKLPLACCSSEETPVNARYLLSSARRDEVLLSTESERLWAFFQGDSWKGLKQFWLQLFRVLCLCCCFWLHLIGRNGY